MKTSNEPRQEAKLRAIDCLPYPDGLDYGFVNGLRHDYLSAKYCLSDFAVFGQPNRSAVNRQLYRLYGKLLATYRSLYLAGEVLFEEIPLSPPRAEDRVHLLDGCTAQPGCDDLYVCLRDYVQALNDNHSAGKRECTMLANSIASELRAVLFGIVNWTCFMNGMSIDYNLLDSIDHFCDRLQKLEHAKGERSVNYTLNLINQQLTNIKTLYYAVTSHIERELKALLRDHPNVRLRNRPENSVDFDSFLAAELEESRREGRMLFLDNDDRRLAYLREEHRYDSLTSIMKLWYTMPPSVMRFLEGCRLLEEAAILAARDPVDFAFSCRSFVGYMLLMLYDHPKSENAKALADFAFTDDEKRRMAEGLRTMALAMLRLRNASQQKYHDTDCDEVDGFMHVLHEIFDKPDLDYIKLLFEEGNADTSDGFNNIIFWRLMPPGLHYMPNDQLDESAFFVSLDSIERVNARLQATFAMGDRAALDALYRELLSEAKPPQPADPAVPADPAPVAIERGAPAAPAPDLSKAPRHGRFAYLKKPGAIADTLRPDLDPYLRFTAPAAVAVLELLLKAIGNRESKGWVKSRKDWRMTFKDGVYKRFKREQIELGSRANGHFGYWRIRPDKAL